MMGTVLRLGALILCPRARVTRLVLQVVFFLAPPPPDTPPLPPVPPVYKGACDRSCHSPECSSRVEPFHVFFFSCFQLVTFYPRFSFLPGALLRLISTPEAPVLFWKRLDSIPTLTCTGPLVLCALDAPCRHAMARLLSSCLLLFVTAHTVSSTAANRTERSHRALLRTACVRNF